MAWAAAAPFLMAGLQGGLNLLGGMFGAGQQQSANMRMAQWQHDRNWDMLQYQLNYNSPANQRKRMEEAGFNPNSLAGNATSGNMTSMPTAPDVRAADYQSMFLDLGTKLQQSRLLSAQADLTQQRVEESGIKQTLMTAQTDLVKANPYMKSEYVNSMVRSLSAAADLKQQQRNFMVSVYDKNSPDPSRGMIMMQTQLDSLIQKYDLGSKDLKIKAAIIESKGFQNDLEEIQRNWMKDGDITPQHIYTGILLLLQKMMSK